jgi:hypothetical protein
VTDRPIDDLQKRSRRTATAASTLVPADEMVEKIQTILDQDPRRARALERSDGAHDYPCIVRPPETLMVWPVM